MDTFFIIISFLAGIRFGHLYFNHEDGRKKAAELILEQHNLSSMGEDRRYSLRMAECQTRTCNCFEMIEMIMEGRN